MDYPKNIRGTFAIQTALRGTSVQSDWDERDTTSEAFIKNKPLVYTRAEADIKFALKTALNNYVTTTSLTFTLASYAKTEDVNKAIQSAITSAITTTLNTAV